MFQVTNKSKIKTKIIHGPGFSLKVPTEFNGRDEADPNKQWGYGEFFQIKSLGEDCEPQTNVFFYYWENGKTAISEKQSSQLIETVCKQRVFSGEHILEQYEIFPVHFKRNAGFISKYRFSHQDPEAAGKANFYVLCNPVWKKVVVLGSIIQSIGWERTENENMTWIEDQIISSFRFKRNSAKRN